MLFVVGESGSIVLECEGGVPLLQELHSTNGLEGSARTWGTVWLESKSTRNLHTGAELLH